MRFSALSRRNIVFGTENGTILSAEHYQSTKNEA